MRKQLLGSVAALVLVGSSVALAAPKQPVPSVDPWTWTGWYVGANVGYSWGRSDSSATFSAAPSSTSSSKFNMDGAIGGFQGGYNYQSGMWVLGGETDFQWADQRGSADGTFACPAAICQLGNPGTRAPNGTGTTTPLPVVVTTYNQKLDWFGTVRGRFGGTVTPSTLLYATGGLAYGHITTSGSMSGQTFTGGTTAPTTGSAFSANTTKTGWTVGGGVETRVMGNWTAKFEYLYVDLGRVSVTGSLPTNFIPTSVTISSKITDNILRAGVNYKF